MYFANLAVTCSYDEATGTMDGSSPRSTEDDFPGMHDEFDAVAYHYGTVKLSAGLLAAGLVRHGHLTLLRSSLSGQLYFFHENVQYEYSYTARKVIRIQRANSILSC